ncbi:MAG: hypothetical protein HC799_13260 [Limnothrix sp. RL_2_0]|nr:hypothetical protein [Limnothrix sp. RL_2_0]
MQLRNILLVASIPVFIGTYSLISTNKVTAESSTYRVEQTEQRKEEGQKGKRRGGLDFAAAASELGITETALKTALGIPETPPEAGQRPPRPDFEAAASQLGITEEALKTALGVPEGGGRGGHRRPDFAAAATQLGVTEEALKTALGVPETRPENGQRPPRPDFAAAATQLGVTETELKEALGVRPRPDAQEQSFNGGGDRLAVS